MDANETTDQPIVDPNPRREIPVGKTGDPVSLGVFLFETFKRGPRGPVADLVAIGPLAVNTAVRGVIEANSRLARAGLYFTVVPTSKVSGRRSATYEDSVVTAFVLVLQDMD
jgi:stage V sporulation protein SpoVS